jgi:CheY-like chemotaxis protein
MIIEDDNLTAFTIAEQLKSLSYNVQASIPSAEEALTYLEQNKYLPEIILMDIHLAGQMSGIEAAHKILKRCDCILIYLTSGSGSKEGTSMILCFYRLKVEIFKEKHKIIDVPIYPPLSILSNLKRFKFERVYRKVKRINLYINLFNQ